MRKGLIFLSVIIALFSCTSNKSSQSICSGIRDSIFIEKDWGKIDASFPVYNNAFADTLIHKIVYDAIAEFKEYTGEEVISENWKNELSLSYHEHILKNGLISVIFTNYQYTGGAHGNAFYHSVVMDIKHEKVYKLADFFTNDVLSNIQKPVRDLLYMQIESPDFIEEGTKVLADFGNFTLTDTSIVFWFSPYQVAAYAYGPQKVELKLDEISNFKWPK